jgi:Uncharacterised nucleotidyltransferase
MRRLVTDGPNADLLEAAQTLVLDAATGTVVNGLRARGIDCLLLRGPAIARRLYPRGGRSYVDADLLVEPRRLPEAEAALSELGFREAAIEAALPGTRPGHAHTWLAAAGRVIDLHRTLIGTNATPDEVWAALRVDAEPLELEGVEVLVPSQAGLALVIALHAAHHADQAPQPLRDLGLALDLVPPVVWREAGELARKLQATGAFAEGLQLDPRGEAELGRLGLASAHEAGPSLTGGRSFHVAQGIALFRATAGKRAKAAFLCERLLPSPRTMRRRSSLARRGAAGLTAAYVARLLDAALHLPRALLALRRTR